MDKNKGQHFDSLTGVYSRHYLETSLPHYLKQILKKRGMFSVVIIDLDHFKSVNDTYGHKRGDAVLIEFAEFIKNSLRGEDMAFRYGGDEFVCILPGTNYKQAVKISQRIIDASRAREFAGLKFTLSIGIASAPEHGTDWPTLFEVADKNLYNAKRHGRDRIGFFEEEKKSLTIPTREIVGRDKELDRIKKSVQVVLNGCGGSVFVGGEIGVGKTRLIHEVIKSIKIPKPRCWESNLSTATNSIPYYPFREIIRQGIEELGIDAIENFPPSYQIELFKIIPELSENKKKFEESIPLVDKFRLFEGVRRFFTYACLKEPLFIFLDNIHWCDEGSLELFHYLVRTLKKNPIFFFTAYRSEESKKSSFQNILQNLSREGLCELITLKPLEIDSVARMLSLILDDFPPPELTEYVFNQTGGNPYFIEELMKALRDNGALIGTKNGWQFELSKKVEIPYTLEMVIQRKLDLVGSEARELLVYCAVLGRKFDFSFLRAVVGMNEGYLFDLLDKILDAGLLTLSKGFYCFSEEMIRELIYNQINKIKLKSYHQTVGEKLLALYTDRLNEVVEELSEHFYISGDFKKAALYSILAGDKAQSSYANQDALRFYTRSLECLKNEIYPNKTLEEIECLRKRAKVLGFIGENKNAISDLECAIRKTQDLADKIKEADCLVELCNIYLNIGFYKEVLRKSKAALKIYKKARDKEGETKSISSIGSAYYYLGKFQKAVRYYKHSLKIAKTTGNRKNESKLLNDIGVMYYALCDYWKALEYWRSALSVNRKIRNLAGEATIYNNIGVVYYLLCDYRKALKYWQSALNMKRKIGDRQGEALVLTNMGNIYNIFGEYPKSLESYNAAKIIYEEIGDRHGEGEVLNNIGFTYSVFGEYSSAMACYQLSLKITKEIGDRSGEGIALANLAGLFIEQNDYPEARKYLVNAEKIAREVKTKELSLNIMLIWGELSIRENKIGDAERYANGALQIAEELKLKNKVAETFLIQARIEAQKGNWKKAQTKFQDAISIFDQLGLPLEKAKAYYYYALDMNFSGRKNISKKYLQMAYKIFERLSAHPWLKRVKKKLSGYI
uniref:Diguanylate cyclase n=1 Tax=candidate division WOR-3 bacterium TaxID=2052148 RepID=A0A7C4XL44_UNCW3